MKKKAYSTPVPTGARGVGVDFAAMRRIKYYYGKRE